LAKIENNSSLKTERTKKGGFYGVPAKSNVYIQPTEESLVSLVEYPFFIIDLKNVEVVNFERIVYGIKSFDICFVNRNLVDYNYIQSVDIDYLDNLKAFLDSNNICFITTQVNLQWNNLLKTIKKDPVSFYESGSWNELQPHKQVESDDSTMSDLGTSEDEEDEISSDISQSSYGNEDNVEEESDYTDEEEYCDEDDMKRIKY